MRRMLTVIAIVGLIATTVFAVSKYYPLYGSFTTSVDVTNDIHQCELAAIRMSFATPQNNTVKMTISNAGYTNILLEGTSATMESATWVSDGGPLILKKNDVIGIENSVATAAGYQIDRVIK